MTNKISIFALLIATLALIVAAVHPAGGGSRLPQKETSYEHVLRTGVLRCGYVNWLPYYARDLKTGEQSGISYEILNAIGKELDLKIEWTEEVGWGNLGEGLKTGRYDAVCTSLWPDGSKIKNFTLSRPMFYSQLYPYVRANDNRFDGNLESINQPNVKISAVDSSFQYNLAKDVFPKAQIVALPPMTGEAEFFLAIVDNKADVLAAIDADEIKGFMQNNPGTLKQVANVPPVHIFPHVMTFGPDEKQLADKIDFALDLLIDNGIMEHILKKYSDSYLLRDHGYAPNKP